MTDDVMPAENMTPSPEESNDDVVLEVQDIVKRFPGVLANSNVNFKLRRGEILALLGENGAGKSTLMNIIYGLYQQDEGEVYLKGKEVRFSNPREAIHSGIGMVHQHFQLVPVMSVAENVVLGEERERPKLLNLFWGLFLTFLVMILGYQLTYANSPLFALLGNFMGDDWGGAQSLIYDMLVILFFAAFLPFAVFMPILAPKADKPVSANMLVIRLILGIVAAGIIVALRFIIGLFAGDSVGDLITETGQGSSIFSQTILILIGIVALITLRTSFRWLQGYFKATREVLFIVLLALSAGGISTGDVVLSKMIPMWGILVVLLIPSYGVAFWRAGNMPNEENHDRWWQAFLGTFVLLAAFGFLIKTRSTEETLQFLVPFGLTLGLSAIVSYGIAYVLTFLFDHWDSVSATMRVVWGFAWRVGLLFVALWMSGLAFRVAQMGITTAILQNQPQIQEERILEPDDFVVAEDTEVNPLAKGSTVQTRSFTPNWRGIEQAGDSFDDQFDELFREIDEAYIVTATQQTEIDTYRLEAQSNEWQGLDPVLRDAVEETPPIVEDLVLSLLLILFAILGIRSWRGRQPFPSVFSNIGLGTLVALGIFYVGFLIVEPSQLSTGIHVVIVLIGIAAIGSSIYFTHRDRINRQDEILPINPIDTIIDAILSNLYVALSVRDTQKAANHVRELSRQYGLEVDPTAIIEKLPVGLQQRVEIIKALYREADVLILDEPTAVLTPQEGKELFRIMRELAAEGVSIIFITHKLKEVFEVANRIVVMRGGEVVGTTTTQDATEASLAAMMVGREVLLRVDKDEAQPAEPILEVEGLYALDNRGAPALKGVSFDVRAGEVLGIAGVQGNGQTELVEVLTGLRKLDEGAVRLMGQPLKSEHPALANYFQRMMAVLIDILFVGAIAIIVSYFISYLGEDSEAFKLSSQNTLISFLAIDAAYHLWMWSWRGQTLGKMMQGIRIEVNDVITIQIPTGEGSIGINPLLLIRYLLQTPVRYIATFAVFDRIYWLIGSETHPETAAILGFFGMLIIPVVISLLLDNVRETEKTTTIYDSLFQMRVVQSVEITPRRIKDAQVSHVPEDRLRFGLVKPFTVADNLILNDYYESPYAEAPDAPQLFPLTAIYGTVFGLVFFALGTAWVSMWNSFIWSSVLDYFHVPSRYSTVPSDRALTGPLAQYLSDPLMVSLLSLIIVTLVLSIVAHLIASLVMRFSRAGLLNLGWQPKKGLVLNSSSTLDHANALIDEFDIRTPSALTTGGSLSGGNQQKVVVAREFSRKPRLLIASQPTRGIDVGSIEFIHKQIIAQRDEGAAVLLVSAELDEIMSLADRIAVMYRGEVIDEVDAATATREQLGLLMAGIKD